MKQKGGERVHPLSVFISRELEEKAYEAGKRKIPVQLYGDLNGKITEKLGEVQPAFCGEYQFTNLKKIPR